jgi:hypothetical protein
MNYLNKQQSFNIEYSDKLWVLVNSLLFHFRLMVKPTPVSATFLLLVVVCTNYVRV